MQPNKIITVKVTDGSFLRTWMELLAPWHKLSSRERDVAARILAQYFFLKSKIDDPELVRDMLLSQTSKQDIRESLGMSHQHFHMVLRALRESGFLQNDEINPRYIPYMTDEPRFMLAILFDWSTPNNPIKADAEKKQD